MANQGVHEECGFVDDVSPGKFSDFTSIDFLLAVFLESSLNLER